MIQIKPLSPVLALELLFLGSKTWIALYRRQMLRPTAADLDIIIEIVSRASNISAHELLLRYTSNDIVEAVTSLEKIHKFGESAKLLDQIGWLHGT